ncbi:MAG: hypothetical protein ACLTBV_30760 [Enterocloster bolteae]
MRGTRKAKETEYRIFKEFNTKTDRDRVYPTAGHKIRVDIFEGYLWQVPELLRCKTGRSATHATKESRKTYHIDILPA